jgi:hypothetical protein
MEIGTPNQAQDSEPGQRQVGLPGSKAPVVLGVGCILAALIVLTSHGSLLLKVLGAAFLFLGGLWEIMTTLAGRLYFSSREISLTNGFTNRSILLTNLRSIGYRRSGAGAKLVLTDDSGRIMGINIRGFKRDDEWGSLLLAAAERNGATVDPRARESIAHADGTGSGWFPRD